MIRNPFPFAFLILFVTACGAPTQAVYPTQTPDPIQAYVDANASKGTAVAAVATAEYLSMQLTATVETRNQAATQQEFSLQSTQQAASILATECAWNATSTAGSRHATETASAVAQQSIWAQRAMELRDWGNWVRLQQSLRSLRAGRRKPSGISKYRKITLLEFAGNQ